MQPRIQYAKTEDGVNIAYATYGEGEPLGGRSAAATGIAKRTRKAQAKHVLIRA